MSQIPLPPPGLTESENRALWYDFHERMRETHRRLAEEHETEALSLLESGEAR